MDKERRLEFSKYFSETAKECLDDAKFNFDFGRFKVSVNRAYYAVFNAMRAVAAIEGFDSKKHSGLISHFNFTYLRTKTFNPETSKLIFSAFEARGDADYEAFHVVSADDAKIQIDNAEHIISMIEPYLKSCWAEMEAKQ